MNGSIVIRKLNPGDSALAESLILMFGDDNDEEENFQPPTREYISSSLARHDFHAIVALDDELLVGGLTAYEMAMFKRDSTEMFLYEIEVAESHRRQGIGGALIAALKQICAEKGIVEMFVGTSKDNAAARKLYESTGGKSDEDSVWFNYLFS